MHITVTYIGITVWYVGMDIYALSDKVSPAMYTVNGLSVPDCISVYVFPEILIQLGKLPQQLLYTLP